MNLEFFKMVSEAAFSNPFGDKRPEIVRRIVDATEDTGWHEMLLPLLQRLEKNIHALSSSAEAMEDLRGQLKNQTLNDDTRAVGVSILFHVFHQYMNQFDDLIGEQVAAGDESCRAPFAFQCLEKLVGYGFKRDNACRYVAMFYQIRRAYFFISKELIGESP